MATQGDVGPSEGDVYEQGLKTFHDLWEATQAFYEQVVASGLNNLLYLFLIFAVVQGLGQDFYRLAKYSLRLAGRWFFILVRADILSQFARGPTCIIVTEHVAQINAQLPLLRVNECISRGSYQSLSELSRYLAKRGLRRVEVVGDKQQGKDGARAWQLGGQIRYIVLGSQINNLAAQQLAKSWGAVHQTKIQYDSDPDDGAVGLTLYDRNGHPLHSIRTTRDSLGNGEDGAILVYSKRRVTGSLPVLQIAGCSSIGTQALVDCLVSHEAIRNKLSFKAIGRDDFVAFFSVSVLEDAAGQIKLVDVFTANQVHKQASTKVPAVVRAQTAGVG